MAFTLQAAVNSQLRHTIGNPLLASFISFFGGTVTLFVCLFFCNNSFLPSVAAIDKIRWWQLTGGILGAFFVYVAITTVVKIGSANMFSLIVAGQLLLAVLLDHFGLLGFTAHKATALRLLGIALLILGVYIIQKN